MLIHVHDAYRLLDDPAVTGDSLKKELASRGVCDFKITTVVTDKTKIDFIRILFPGAEGKTKGGCCPTTAIIGQLGGIAAYPDIIGLLSDADGAIIALACALRLQDLIGKGYTLPGDVCITTHICTSASTVEREPVMLVELPISIQEMNRHMVVPDANAVISVDATKGNNILNKKGIAITPTVKEGYILRVSDALLQTLGIVTGKPPVVLPITTQDITPYGNGVYHINTIMQPAAATDAPVVGLAVTSGVAVPGCATGANDPVDLEMATRFCLEVAKRFGEGRCPFYSKEEFEHITSLYGSMKHLFK